MNKELGTAGDFKGSQSSGRWCLGAKHSLYMSPSQQYTANGRGCFSRTEPGQILAAEEAPVGEVVIPMALPPSLLAKHQPFSVG